VEEEEVEGGAPGRDPRTKVLIVALSVLGVAAVLLVLFVALT
jgi:hypothetical protein